MVTSMVTAQLCRKTLGRHVTDYVTYVQAEDVKGHVNGHVTVVQGEDGETTLTLALMNLH